MNITVSKKDLVPALALAASVSAQKSTMAMLGNVLLRASGEGLTVSATDLYVGTTQTINATVTTPGCVALPARDLLERVKLMPDGPVTIANEDGKATLSAPGKGRTFRLYSDNGEDFPGLAERKPDAPEVRIPCAELARILLGALRCVDSDESRAIACVRVRWGNGAVDAVATNGKTLLSLNGAAPEASDPGAVLLPPKAARELARMCEGKAGSVLLSPMWPWTFAGVEGVQLSIKHSHELATYPAVESAIPKGGSPVTIGRTALLDAIRVAVLAADSNKAILLDIGKGGMRVSAECSKGDACDVVPITWTKKDLGMAVDYTFMTNVLGAIPDGVDEFEIVIDGRLDPIQVKAPDLLGLLMPIDLSRGKEATGKR